MLILEIQCQFPEGCAQAAAADKIDRFEKRGRYGEKVGEAGSGGCDGGR